jgi:hypothetical protein
MGFKIVPNSIDIKGFPATMGPDNGQGQTPMHYSEVPLGTESLNQANSRITDMGNQLEKRGYYPLRKSIEADGTVHYFYAKASNDAANRVLSGTYGSGTYNPLDVVNALYTTKDLFESGRDKSGYDLGTLTRKDVDVYDIYPLYPGPVGTWNR